jgi:5'-3' exonuclease (including N-terminal domain of PolI)
MRTAYARNSASLPSSIPDFLALVGDAADGYPGIAGIGKTGAARLLNTYGPLEQFPATVLEDTNREQALLFKKLATLRTDAALFANVDELRWRGPQERFASLPVCASDPRVVERARKAFQRQAQSNKPF